MMSAKRTMYGKPLSVMIQFHTENREKVRVMSAKMYGKPPSLMIQLMPHRKEGESKSDVIKKDNVWKAAECNDSVFLQFMAVHGGFLQFMAALCNVHFMPYSKAKLAWLLVSVLPITPAYSAGSW